jgi:hypothetical protein
MIATASRAARVDKARETALPRKPLPVLLILVRAYRDGWRDGLGPDGSLAFGPRVDRIVAMARLVRELDAAEPGDFGRVVAKWAAETRARWVTWRIEARPLQARSRPSPGATASSADRP